MRRLPSLKAGFTILELLVVVGIVGILAAVAVFSLSITRASNRDAKRISDISVIRASLTQYWLQKATYPENDPVQLARPGVNADKLTGNGFVNKDIDANPVYLLQVPTGPTNNEFYIYKGSNQGYSLKFVTERPTAYGAAGAWFAHTDGVDKDDSIK